MKSEQIESSKQEVLYWQSWFTDMKGLSKKTIDLMNQIAELIATEDVEEKYKQICAIQEQGNKTHGTEIKPRESFKASAMIELAQERGIINQDEAMDLQIAISAKS